MDAKEVLRKADTIVYIGSDEQLKKFLSVYFMVSDGLAICGKSVIVYSDIITTKDLKRGCGVYWSEKKVSDETRAALSGCVLVEGLNIRDEYTKYFLSSCSA